MPELIELLEIPPGKVVHIIVRSREADAKMLALEEDNGAGSGGGEAGIVPEASPGDAMRELRQYLAGLNLDEQASLIALAWIGRGTYAPGELGEAIAAAKAEHAANAAAYLASLPLLPVYLEDALNQLEIDAADAETGVSRPAHT